jgi:hypothetical protein
VSIVSEAPALQPEQSSKKIKSTFNLVAGQQTRPVYNSFFKLWMRLINQSKKI